jgi:hypothetical protein
MKAGKKNTTALPTGLASNMWPIALRVEKKVLNTGLNTKSKHQHLASHRADPEVVAVITKNFINFGEQTYEL